MKVKIQKELEKDGWEKRTLYDEPRLSEMVEMYEEIGFEVMLMPFDPDDEPGCIECMKTQPELFKTIYTRKRKNNFSFRRKS
jgi:hypothetical protein